MNKTNKFLYRYYSKDEYALDVVANRRLYFCLPSELNDPFDCRPLISLRYSKHTDNKVWHKFLYHLAKVKYSGQPELEIKKHADAAFANGLHKNQRWLNEVSESFRNVGTSVRVCCFGNSPRNTMLWAHYAQNHSGIVFQFRFSGLYCKDSREFRGQPVNYLEGQIGVKKYVDAFDRYEKGDVLSMARLIYTTKTKHWKGEDEVRFFTDSAQEYVSFDESTLAGIIFGDKCSSGLVREVRDELSKWHQRPRFQLRPPLTNSGLVDTMALYKRNTLRQTSRLPG